MAATSSTRQADPEDEDAAELKFSKEFQSCNAETLLTSEVYMLLDHRRAQTETTDDLTEMSEMFLKTLNYTQRMAKFKNRDIIRSLRALLSSFPELEKFEIAQICNLCPETAEEAKALIPSLENKFSDEKLDEILKDLHSKKTFQ